MYVHFHILLVYPLFSYVGEVAEGPRRTVRSIESRKEKAPDTTLDICGDYIEKGNMAGDAACMET
jgi:hypothetical protein